MLFLSVAATMVVKLSMEAMAAQARGREEEEEDEKWIDR